MPTTAQYSNCYKCNIPAGLIYVTASGDGRAKGIGYYPGDFWTGRRDISLPWQLVGEAVLPETIPAEARKLGSGGTIYKREAIETGDRLGKSLKLVEIEYVGACPRLEKVAIPGTVGQIHKNAFSDCPNLSSVSFKSGEGLSIGEGAFKGCKNLSEVTFGGGTKLNIAKEAFGGCEALESITLPKQCTEVDLTAFQDCPLLENIYVEEGNPVYVSIDGVLCKRDGELAIYPPGRDAMDIVVPEGVTYVRNGAFAKAATILSVSLPSTLREIGEEAFRGCRNLLDIKLPPHLRSIGAYAFAECSALPRMELPVSLTQLGHHAFAYCSSLTEMRVPGGVGVIDVGTFEGCFELRHVQLGEGVQIVSRYAFYGCEALETLVRPKSLKEVSKEAFGVVID